MEADTIEKEAELFVRKMFDDMDRAHETEMEQSLRELKEFEKAIKSPAPMLLAGIRAGSSSDEKGRLHGYDMVTALTQNTINSQLLKLWGYGIIPKTIDITLDEVGQTLKAQIDAPSVSFSDTGSYTKVCLILPLISGTYSCWNLSENPPVKEEKKIDNWVLAFNVNLSMQQINQDAIANNENIPDVVKKRLSSFTDDLFRISHLFLDLQNADLANLDKIKTKIPASMSPTEFSQFIYLFEGYISILKSENNPFVLGFSIDTKDQAHTTDKMPLFAPTGVTFSRTRNQSISGLSTLNYNMMTNNSLFPTQLTADVYNNPWVQDEDTQGTMAISAAQFREKFIGQIILPTIIEFARIPVEKWERDGDEWKLDWKQIERLKDYAYGPTKVCSQRSHERSCTVKLDPGNKPIIQAKGKYYIKLDFWDHISTWLRCWCSVRVEWEIRIEISPGIKGGELQVKAYPKKSGNPVEEKDEHWLMKLADFFTSIFNTSFTEQLSFINNQVTSLFDMDYRNLESSIKNKFRAVKNLQILPAGDIFFMKDAQLDSERNLLLRLTYKD